MKSHRALLPLSLLLAAPALAQAPNVGALPETEKVRGDLPPPPLLTSIALSDAQNEFAAFQLVVADSGAPVTVEDVSLSDLTGPGGAKLSGASALVYREAMVAVMSPSNSAGAVGDWPDPLVPKLDDFYGETRNAFPVTVSAGRSQPFYLELHVPAGQPPGGYAGAATASFSDGTSASVPVTLRVRAFALPSTSSLTTAFGFDWDGPCVGHFGGYGAPNCTDPQLEALNALYFQDALNHRLTISALVYAPPVSSGQGSFSTFDQLYGPFLNGTALTKPDQLQGAQLTSIQYVGDWSSASFAAWAAHFKANGWFSRLFDYTCDEPPMTCAWSDIPTRAAIVHAGDPNFRTLVTTDLANATANGVLSSIDILVPIDNSLDPASGDTRPAYANFLTTPDSLLWTYQSCSPTSTCVDGAQGGDPSWPMRYLDESAASNRLLEWVDFAENVTGELYYDTTMSMAVYGAAAWQNEYVFGNNGDGSLFYPGSPSIIGGTHDIPIESLRLKLLRGGLQDYEYLHELSALGDVDSAKAALALVAQSASQFTQDGAVFEEARAQMADAIERDLGVSSSGGGAPDAGTAASDAGTPAPDAGTPASDAGTETPDAGTETPDAGSSNSPDGGGSLWPALDIERPHAPLFPPLAAPRSPTTSETRGARAAVGRGCGTGPGGTDFTAAVTLLLAAMTLGSRPKRLKQTEAGGGNGSGK